MSQRSACLLDVTKASVFTGRHKVKCIYMMSKRLVSLLEVIKVVVFIGC